MLDLNKCSAVIRINKSANKGRGQLMITVPRKSGFKGGERVVIVPADISPDKETVRELVQVVRNKQ